MERDYGMEIDMLKKELEEVKGLLRGLVQRNVAALGQPAVQEENCGKKEEDAGGQLPGGNEINRGIHSPGSAPYVLQHLRVLVQRFLKGLRSSVACTRILRFQSRWKNFAD